MQLMTFYKIHLAENQSTLFKVPAIANKHKLALGMYAWLIYTVKHINNPVFVGTSANLPVLLLLQFTYRLLYDDIAHVIVLPEESTNRADELRAYADILSTYNCYYYDTKSLTNFEAMYSVTLGDCRRVFAVPEILESEYAFSLQTIEYTNDTMFFTLSLADTRLTRLLDMISLLHCSKDISLMRVALSFGIKDMSRLLCYDNISEFLRCADTLKFIIVTQDITIDDLTKIKARWPQILIIPFDLGPNYFVVGVKED